MQYLKGVTPRWKVLLIVAALESVLPPVAGAMPQPKLPGVLDVSPVPGARLVLPRTMVTLRTDHAVAEGAIALAAAIAVTGVHTGVHAGQVRSTGDGRTFVFVPERPFAWGERVTVTLRAPWLAATPTREGSASFTFTIAAAPPPHVAPSWRAEMEGAAMGEAQGPSLPTGVTRNEGELPPDFPAITTHQFQPTAQGVLFLANVSFGPPSVPYLMVIDDSGTPAFYREMAGSCFDFKLQPNGQMTYYDESAGKFYVMNNGYVVVDSFAAGNGYATDLHELRLLTNGHALLMSYDPETVDMSAVVPGGNPAATVIGMIVQEVDDQQNVWFQWRSWDHYAITDATHEDLTAATIDYVHGNAIAQDVDGNLLVSCRHMDEITKIDRTNGNILWRWGGSHNEFTFVDDPVGFSHQHAVRRLPTGHFTLYDNGNFHSPSFSRAVEYVVDETAKTARLVWQYRNTPDIYGFAMGYAQRLSNGNTLISWGAGKPDLTEVDADGTPIMDLSLPSGIFTYRAYRFELSTATDVPRSPIATAGLQLEVRPNPLRSRGEVVFTLAAPSRVSVEIHDLAGRAVTRLAEGVPFEAGTHRLAFDLSRERPGLFFFTVAANGRAETCKLLLIR